jgi:hypothetical protein
MEGRGIIRLYREFARILWLKGKKHVLWASITSRLK